MTALYILQRLVRAVAIMLVVAVFNAIREQKERLKKNGGEAVWR